MQTTTEKVYLKDLEELKSLAATIPTTKMMAIGKVNALIMLNMRYETIAFNRNLDKHPYELVEGLVQDAYDYIKNWSEIRFIEKEEAEPFAKFDATLEDAHQELFQKLWVNFSKEEYDGRITCYTDRLTINQLTGDFLKGKRCVDFGCGHGNFAHALLQEGAASVCGIDFGTESIKYATQARDILGVTEDQIKFVEGTVYKTPFADNEFDFAIQNGVFHHLENEDVAIEEMHRVLKPGGGIWYYTDGAGGISYDLWDASLEILKDVPQPFIVECLKNLNISTNKRYHLGDGLNAVYRHTTWEEITSRLSKFGFGNFRRLTGGRDTDFDHDTIEADKYGREKFGEGDLRLYAEKI